MEVCTFALTFVSSMQNQERLLSTSPNTESNREPGWGRVFLLSRSKSGFPANCHGWSIKTIHYFYCGKLGIFKCECMPFGLCNASTTFQRLMQKCLVELNLTYHLIYFDNVIAFSKMEEEQLKCLCVVFDCFWKHSLRLKPTKCKFFWDEISCFFPSCL